MADIAQNQGALLFGGFISVGLSGMVTVQVIMYFKLYPLDPPILKSLVIFLWALDFTHSALIIASVWDYVIQNFGNAGDIDNIPVVLSTTITLTAIITSVVHCFFAHRIFLLSRRSWVLTIPILFLAIFRLCSAAATCAEMIRVQTFSSFKAEYRWLFSLGLAVSSIVDIIITLCLFTLLRKSRTAMNSGLDQIIDSLILYAFEVGFLTCAGTIVTMICWLVMDDNLIFMALHFAIGKLYSNSLLAALNTRQHLRSQRRQPSQKSSAQNMDLRRRETYRAESPYMDTDIPLNHVHVNIEKRVTYDPMTSGSSAQEA